MFRETCNFVLTWNVPKAYRFIIWETCNVSFVLCEETAMNSAETRIQYTQEVTFTHFNLVTTENVHKAHTELHHPTKTCF